MEHSRVSNEDMQKRIVRFSQLQEQGIPLMFIDSVLPGHQRMNFAVIGDTASENAEFEPMITAKHGFQIGVVCAPPRSGPAYHSHDYIEMFMPMSGQWRFYWGNDAEGEPEGEETLGPWDMITLPPGLYRGFENVSSEPSWIFAVLESHEVFKEKDPYWSPKVERAAREHGFNADSSGKMVPPTNYAEVKAQLLTELSAVVRSSKTPLSSGV